jgi:Leucine-rich repeat (LRR) protein
MPLDNEILQRLRNNDSTLTSLSLISDQISDEGAKALAEVIEKNTTLTSLNLGWNEINAEGAKALVEVIVKNTSLRALYLGHNQISDEGAKTITEVLAKNRTLTELCLYGNPISDAGAQAIVQALEKNTSLSSLGLGDYQISADVKKRIEGLIERNKRLLEGLQATALEQLKAGRVLLSKSSAADNNAVSLANLPLEIREHIVKMLDGKEQMTEEQQRLILNYAEGKIAPVADKLSFFKVTKCDRVMKQLQVSNQTVEPPAKRLCFGLT